MIDREKAIRILEGNYKSFVLRHNGELLTVNELIALLKAQKPRVMTLEEATNAECVFYDWCSRGVRPAKVTRVPYKTGTYRVQRFGDIDEWVRADEYGEYWRCWTALPTDKQRKAVKWDDQADRR